MQIFHFADNSHPLQLGMLGGKGYSLAWMTQSGLPVPPGFVLTVRFFDPWVDKLKQTSQWRNFLSASSEKLTDRSMSLQAAGMDLSFTEEQEGQLKEALSRYQKFQFFAVRSSSPEEDLEGASFAGGYETILGVNRENMKNAVRRAFCSCLHPRVFIYKKERGFALEDFRIAVVVQAQVDSDVSGVGFSVNPLNNDYDEAVFNSNWGLGETVVSGLVSPDQIIVDKVSRKIINFQIGKKETSFWLNHDGGTEDRPDPRHKERTLTDEQVLGLTDQLSQIEALHGRPMDIEWALSGGKIFLLQARPITTHWPLPAILITPPHARRRLYLDISLVIQAMVEPISVLGTDILRGWLKAFFKEALGAERLVDVENGLVCAEGGRLYLNLSNAWHLFGSFGKLADKLQRMDALSSEILKQVDETAYKSLSAPKPIERIRLQALLKKPDIILNLLAGAISPAYLEKKYRQESSRFLYEIKRMEKKPPAIQDYFFQVSKRTVRFLVHMAIPTFVFSQLTMVWLKKMIGESVNCDDEVREQLSSIDQSLPHNLTIEMGLSLYQLSQLLDKEEYASYENFLKCFKEGALPSGFKEAWQEFLSRYGFRGPGEMDIANPRYKDRPDAILSQIFWMMHTKNDRENPQEYYDQCQMKRKKTRDQILGILNPKSRFQVLFFKQLYRIMETFGGYREHHKYFLVLANSLIRERVLQIGDRLVESGRLSHCGQVFDLTFEELCRAGRDSDLDLRAAGRSHRFFFDLIKKRGHPPPIIDSRGRVFMPKQRPLAEGEIGGQPVSAGVARGQVKVLHTPGEKPLLPGEILVARATDPGWTPLFVNAAAIVLEIGGMLQHGALVAREYGKPCIVGVLNATEEFQDGDYVEVDGAAGIIRRNIDKEKTQT